MLLGASLACMLRDDLLGLIKALLQLTDCRCHLLDPIEGVLSLDLMLFLYPDKGFSRLIFVPNHEVSKLLEERCVSLMESATESLYFGYLLSERALVGGVRRLQPLPQQRVIFSHYLDVLLLRVILPIGNLFL